VSLLDEGDRCFVCGDEEVTGVWIGARDRYPMARAEMVGIVHEHYFDGDVSFYFGHDQCRSDTAGISDETSSNCVLPLRSNDRDPTLRRRLRSQLAQP
jgi:hypothetical protein